MKDILAPRHRERLRAMAANGALLAFDFDGTLAPFIGQDPAGAQLRPETAELLHSLAHCAPVAVITGRSVADASSRLRDLPLLAVIGNHGAEPSPYARRAARAVAAWLPQVHATAAEFPGVMIENKALSISVHVANATEPFAALRRFTALARELPGKVRAVEGTDLVNLVAAGAPNKGDALLALQRTHALTHVVFVGDELTDEPAFRVIDPAVGLAIRVGSWRGSAAPFAIASQLDINALLAELLVGRTRPRSRSASAELATAVAQPTSPAS